MNITEKLLIQDQKLKRKAKKKEIHSPGLSELLGEDINITIKEIPNDEFFELKSMISDDDDDSIDLGVYSREFSLAGIKEPDFHKKEVYEKFEGAITPLEAIDVAFGAMELLHISSAVAELSGAGNTQESEKKVNEVKN